MRCGGAAHLVPECSVGAPAGLRPVAQALFGQQVQQAPRGAGAGAGVQLAAGQAVHVRREPRQDLVVRRRLPQQTPLSGVAHHQDQCGGGELCSGRISLCAAACRG